MRNKVDHIDFMDALRGIAVLGVLLCHTYAAGYGYGNEFTQWKGWYRTFSADAYPWLYPFSWGRAGVSLFFVISGFCIHMSFRKSGQKVGYFFVRRFFRIYPTYVTALVFVFLMMFRHLSTALQDGYFWDQFTAHLFFIHNFSPATFKAVNPPLWSLAVEVQLYLLYPVLLALAIRVGWRRILFYLAVVELFIQGAGAWAGGPVFEGLANSPFGYWFSWTLGAVIADAFLNEEPLPFLKVHPLWWIALAVASDFFRPLQPFCFTLSALAAAGIISRRLNAMKLMKPGIVSSLFSARILILIGLCSYSLYLLHYPLLDIYFNAVDWFYPQAYQSRPILMLLMCATWVAIIPVAILWYRVIELPGIALGKWLIAKTSRQIKPQNTAGGQPVNVPAIVPVSSSNHYYLSVGLLVVFVTGHILAGSLFAPTPSEELAHIAWSLATSPDATDRDGALALKYARRACRQTGFAQPAFIGIMSAAFAEDGRFNDAIVAVQYSSKLAAQAGDTNTLQMNQMLLPLYQNHHAYHAEGAKNLNSN